jgi:hypothetical protein
MLLSLLALWGGAHGCASPPTRPPSPPSGGHVLVLSFADFQSSVSPVLERQGCDAGGDCHGGGIRGTFQLSPSTAKDLQFDFDQVVMQAYPTVRDSSPILTRPLAIAAGGTAHPFKPFATTSDPDYVSIRTWIMAGVLQ